MSMFRAERIGPTSGALWHWKTAANRVIPPSTGSSKTMSAWFEPGLRPAAGVVCDLHRQRRATGDTAPAGHR